MLHEAVGFMNLSVFMTVCLCVGQYQPIGSSYLAQPAYCLGEDVHGPVAAYGLQPGDIFLATDKALWSRVGHAIAGGPGLHHSGVVFALPNGALAILEAGPYNTATIQVLDPWKHMNDHVQAGDHVYIRRRKVPLTTDQSARLTAFALEQNGKPFATIRMLRQVTPLRTRGPIRTYFMGYPNGSRDKFFCSELATETCVAAGLMNRETARPSATYPADLFWGRSSNPYLDDHLCMDSGWFPPARWFPTPPCR